MTSKLNFVPAIFLVASLFTGCSTFEEGVSQTVSVYSFPAGAEVSVQGETVGTTPLEMSLPRKTPHIITLSKPGYKEWQQEIFPVMNEGGFSTVKFSIAEDLGYYYDLQPSPVEVQMQPANLPNTVGIDPYEEMTSQILAADQRLQNGEISTQEHRYIVDQITKFYTKDIASE